MTAPIVEPRAGLTAAASITADVADGRTRIRWSQAWPIVLRPTGAAQVHLVHGAGGPLNGDVLSLDLHMGDGARLAVRSAGATLVQPGRGRGPARWATRIAVGADGDLTWAPEPTIVADGAFFDTSLRIDLGAGARACVREIVVLGRHGTTGGDYRGRLDVLVDGAPLLTHTTVLSGTDPALVGPGGTAGARAVGTLVVVPAAAGGVGCGEEPGVRWAWTDLPGPGRALMAVGTAGAVLAVLESAMESAQRSQPREVGPEKSAQKSRRW